MTYIEIDLGKASLLSNTPQLGSYTEQIPHISRHVKVPVTSNAPLIPEIGNSQGILKV